jgi:hypothetical protein
MRSIHDLGLAAWFGGSLMGAIGVNGAAAKVNDSKQRIGVASAGWARWAPVNAAAIGAHVAGAAGELITESPRVFAQSGVGRMSVVKTGLTVAALAVTGYSRLLGMRLERLSGAPVVGVTEPDHGAPRHLASRQRQLRVAQWAVPALTGGLIIITALAGEQQKPGQVVRGVLKRMSGLTSMSKGMSQRMSRGMPMMMSKGMSQRVSRSVPMVMSKGMPMGMRKVGMRVGQQAMAKVRH